MADKPVVNPTPKSEFQSNAKFVSMHRDLMQMPMTSVSIQYALLQMARQHASQPMDGNAAACNFYKLQGAHEFISILRNLGEMPELPKVQPKNHTLT